MLYSFKQRAQRLEDKLFASAFRRGISAFRYGLIPLGYSDHLPIQARVQAPRIGSIDAISWNLLADDHLYNNFMNISGTQHLFEALGSPNSPTNLYGGSPSANRLYHFFSELGQFLYERQIDNHLQIKASLLDDFLVQQPSLLARSRDPEKMAALQSACHSSRQAIIELLKDAHHPSAHEFNLSIMHALELTYHIKQGELKWSSRFNRLKNDNTLVSRLRQADMLSFQECTNPNDMALLLNAEHKKFSMVAHRINERTNDHCVIMYDALRFDSVGEPVRFAIEGKKPGIIITLKDRKSGKQIQVGSIHHPGGNENHLETIMGHLKANMPYLLLGDFNHTSDFFTHHTFHTPNHLGTMAGNDHQQINKAIDGLFTNLNDQTVKIETLECVLPNPAASTQAPVHFYFKDRQILNSAESRALDTSKTICKPRLGN